MIALAVRIDRIEQRLDHEIALLVYPDAGLSLRRHHVRIDRLMETLTQLRTLADEQQRVAQRRVEQTVATSPSFVWRPRAPARRSVQPRQVQPPTGGVLELHIPANWKPLRDDEVELVRVWTPHRDAPSLIGNYGRKAAQ